MPHHRQSKLRARVKRQQAQDETQAAKGAQAIEMEVEVSPSTSSALEDSPQSTPDAGMMQDSERVPPINVPAAAIFDKSEKDTSSQDGARPRISPASALMMKRDPVLRQTKKLLQFLLEKFKKQEPILKADMLRIFSKKYKEHFPEILKQTSDHMELVFGLDLKEVNPSSDTYTLVSKLDLSKGRSLIGREGLPKTGLLMTLLAVIFVNGNRVTEEELWDTVNGIGLHPGMKHILFGEPRKLITQDLVEENYLEYQQIPHSNPPSYEFLWGTRAYAETSKMKVLEFWAKVNNTVPNSFPDLYEEALMEEFVRSGARVPPIPNFAPGPNLRRF